MCQGRDGSEEPTMKEVMIELRWIKRNLTNHLKHHERYEVALVVGILLLVAKQLLFY
jgi:hypothetical protein